MKKRKLQELPEGLKNRMIRLTVEYSVLTGKNPKERIAGLNAHYITYKMWQNRSYYLMVAINEKLTKEGKPKKYEFNT
jgi:hypothetical protein